MYNHIILIKKTNKTDKYINLGNSLRVQKKLEEAVKYYRQALKLNPNNAIALNNLGVTLFELGQTEEAQKLYQKALEINPNYTDALYNLAVLLKTQGKNKEAEGQFRKVINNDPANIRAHGGLGQILKDQGQFDEAIKVFKTAVRIDPKNFQLNYLLADTLRDTGKLKEAIGYYKKALSLNLHHARAWGDLAVAYVFQGRSSLAQKALEKAILIDPARANFFFNLGMVSRKQGRFKKAVANFEKAISLDPDFRLAVQSLFFIKREICDWEGIDKLEETLSKKNFDGHFTSILRSDDPALNLQAARERTQKLEKATPQNIFTFDPGERKNNEKIRLGYISNDFHAHPVGQMVTPVLGYHNKKRFVTYIFSSDEDDGSIWRQMAEKAGHFFDIQTLNQMEAAKLINRHRIDILIDTTGPMALNPMIIPALRPAPIQISWMGILGTTGASFYDYVIGDKIVMPFSHAKFYTEQIVHLPCFSWLGPNDVRSKIKFDRSFFGLPDGKIVFAFFSLPLKIDPAIWNVWMRILLRVPGSVLWLWKLNKEVAENLQKEAKKVGLNPKRLIFFGKLPMDQHLARIPLSDICLDTRIYQGAQTSNSVLGTGVPLITVLGNHFISRVSASMLDKLGLPELVAKDLKEYEEKAVQLALAPENLIKVKRKLTSGLKKNSYDPQKFVQDLEKAYLMMWEKYCADEKPSLIKADL